MDVEPFLKSFQEINHRTIKLLDSLSALTALSELEDVMSDEYQLLDNVSRILLQNQDIERCSIFLVEENRLVNFAGTASSDEVYEDQGDKSEENSRSIVSFKIGEGLIGIAAESGEIQNCKNCSEDERYIKKEGTVVVGDGSLLCVPMTANARVLGVLCAYHPQLDHFNHEHERFFQTFSWFISQILSSVRHTSILEEEVKSRTEMLEDALREADKLKDKFEELAYVDDLTGLYNRRFFFPEATAALSRAIRYKHPFTLMLFDLDDFKKINDNYGHPVGDLVLNTVSNILRQHVREGDILARFGGEEFILALPNTDIESASQLANRILKFVREDELNNDIPDFNITSSVGITCLSTEISGDTSALLDQLVKQADDALLVSKASGKDRFYIHRPGVMHIK